MEKDTGQKLKDIMEKETATKRQYFKAKIREIGRYKSSGRLLDVGCGQGAFLSACTGANFELFGVEPSKYTYAESLKIAPDSTIYNCTLLEAQFSKDSFDVITLINTLEHLVNPKETVSEVYRILKSNGLLMLETPNIGHWIPRLLGKRWVQLLVADHVVFFSKTILKRMLKEIGFEVKHIKYSHKTISIRLLQFHLSRYFMSLNKCMFKIIEGIGLADRTISFPQWDEMVLFAVKEE
jgi:2-polyprenyl-3-methyl-5-hydroxy-6-metoxy-1,4-benzoquinol methylase